MRNPFGELEATTRTVKRAQYEALEFALSPDGVQVRNNSHANPDDHEYLDEIVDGVPVSCTCPADANYSGACKHRVAIAIRRPILEAVKHQQLVADGGIKSQASTQDDSESEHTGEVDSECGCDDLSDDFPCWECYRSGRRELPE